MSIFTLTNLARNRTLSVKNNLHVFCKHLNLQYFLIIKYSRRMYDKSFVCSLAVKVITIQAVCWYTFYCLFTFTRHIYNLVSLVSSGSTSSSSKLTRLETVTCHHLRSERYSKIHFDFYLLSDSENLLSGSNASLNYSQGGTKGRSIKRNNSFHAALY